jgi:hypothetical protein
LVETKSEAEAKRGWGEMRRARRAAREHS